MSKPLTRKDWTEIYYALETKQKLTDAGHYGTCPSWNKHLLAILKKIGLDGKEAYLKERRNSK